MRTARRYLGVMMRSVGLLWGRNLIEKGGRIKKKGRARARLLVGCSQPQVLHYCLNPFYYFDELNISNPVPYADTATSRRKVMP